MKIAVEGCCHGELDRTYAELAKMEQQTKQKVDALIICGDFQAIRNQSDLQCMAVPSKYRQLGQFHQYYTGKKVAPVLTLVIGGNHEASNYMWELYHGGWLAPNIYYLGGANCVRLNGVRIAGCSGIFKAHDYHLGHYEKIPYDNSSLRSVYHVRAYDVFKMSLLTPGLGVCISHDWPEGIYNHGDVEALVTKKPFFREDIGKGELGNPHMMELLKGLRPQWWLSAHLHIKFQAEVDHTGKERMSNDSNTLRRQQKQTETRLNTEEIVMDDDEEDEVVEQSTKELPKVQHPNTDEILMDDEEDTLKDDHTVAPAAEEAVASTAEEGSASSPRPTTSAGSLPETTRFLALDKCLPGRKFLEIIDIPTSTPVDDNTPPRFTFDPEWLAICRAMHPLLSTERRSTIQPRLTLAKNWVQNELEWIQDKLKQKTDELNAQTEASSDGTAELDISTIQRFVMTAPGPSHGRNSGQPLLWYTNPQTEAFCELIGVENKVNSKPPDIGQGRGR
ncbi:hypothetical protein FRC14_001037 [Serendipita sp. 396]|nr:hypothetical protein FRC14_001037 [Serendipita sp. 396]